MGEMVFGRIVQGKGPRVLGDPKQPHTYTYIDDFAQTLLALGSQDQALGRVWHVPSAETITTEAFVSLIIDEADAAVSISAAPSWVVRAMGWFNPNMREVAEMLYESENPFVVDHSRYEKQFGASVTPHREGIRRTLRWYRQRRDGATPSVHDVPAFLSALFPQAAQRRRPQVSGAIQFGHRRSR